MNHRLKDYFRFTRIERRGMYAIILLILSVMLVKEGLIYLNPLPIEQEEKMDSLITVLNRIDSNKERKENPGRIKLNSNADKKSKRFFFNPNNLAQEKWQELGLSLKQIGVIKNYEKKGGEFRVKSDLKKIYSISEKLYTSLEPFIELPDSLSKKDDYNSAIGRKGYKEIPMIVDINYADSAELIKLYGIGPFLAQKIVKHREQLGGYHSIYQLLDIWGITDSLINQLSAQLSIGEIALKKLDINQLNTEQLKQHPYINWSIANSIEQIREQHGLYEKLEDIKKSVLINDSIYRKLLPYIAL